VIFSSDVTGEWFFKSEVLSSANTLSCFNLIQNFFALLLAQIDHYFISVFPMDKSLFTGALQGIYHMYFLGIKTTVLKMVFII